MRFKPLFTFLLLLFSWSLVADDGADVLLNNDDFNSHCSCYFERRASIRGNGLSFISANHAMRVARGDLKEQRRLLEARLKDGQSVSWLNVQSRIVVFGQCFMAIVDQKGIIRSKKCQCKRGKGITDLNMTG